MSMVKCPKCGTLLSEKMNFCPVCGEKMEGASFARTEKVMDKKKWFIIFGAAAVCIFVVVLCIFFMKEEKLAGNDLEAYNLVMEVCKVAHNPEDISVVSGTVVGEGEEAMGSLTIWDESRVYHVIVYYEDGEAVCMDGEASYDYDGSCRELYEKTDSFHADAVNQELRKYWAKNKK